MPNITEWASAGLDAIHVAGRTPGGLFAGYGQLTVADTGDDSGMRRLRGAQVAPVGILEPNRVPVTGDNGRITTFQFASDADNAFTIEMGITDKDFEAFAQGSAVKTIGEWDMGLLGSLGPTFADVMWLLTRDAQSQESDSLNSAGFENMLVLSSQAFPLGDDQFNYQEAGGSRYSAIANQANTSPWGADIGTDFTLADGMVITWFSQYRCMLHCFIGDGTTDDIVVDYTPVTAAKTKAFNATDNVALTVSSITAGTKTVTLSAAPGSGKLCVVIYECLSF